MRERGRESERKNRKEAGRERGRAAERGRKSQREIEARGRARVCTGDGGLVGVGALSAVGAALDVLLGVVPGAPRVVEHDGHEQAREAAGEGSRETEWGRERVEREGGGDGHEQAREAAGEGERLIIIKEGG